MSLDDNANQPPLRLTRLYIEELFGTGSTPIDIRFKVQERVTVLHGRNGSGKTITLELIQAIREGRLEALAAYPLKLLRLELSDGRHLELEPKKGKRPKPGRGKIGLRSDLHLRYRISRAENRIENRIDGELVGPLHVGSEDLPRRVPWLHRIGEDTWFDDRLERELTRSEIGRLYSISPGHSADSSRWSKVALEEHRPLVELLDRLPEIKFIKADRLFVRSYPRESAQMGLFDERRPRSVKSVLMVDLLSQNIRALITQADRQYRLTSTHLDSSLPTRLFAHQKDLPPLDELRARSRALRDQAERLIALGLLREQPERIDEETLTEEEKKTFFVILKDREEKLAPFDRVVAKAQRLLESLNRKLAPKSVRLDVERGYQVLTAAGEPLPLHCLSSGEQHELVLLHELLFDVQPGSLILIDEPELSLHVTWQVDVIPDLLDIARLSDLDVVLATHSPYIVGDHPDLMVRLGEPV